ncbi:AAA family ATPase [Microbacterium sp. ASV49]|uniref:AAA family ATPase n=1 Tax=Microbacterium candidum TaxID=3041922 RepID=A0ABT7MXJ5_9MICO|nr:LuxR family transcriptional regulator [Microbacterium sp. ASV49]MDL9979174.1 AAA family ATPase [Microbacterium sp. ASV49]
MNATGDVVGRDQELRTIHAFLDAPISEAAGLVLHGEPGIGKSTLWQAAVSAARERGCLVLRSRPAEAERGLALMGLGDLLDPVLDGVVDQLTAPRRHALEVALLREGETTGGAADERALVVAVRDVVRLLAARTRVVVAIDDVQWFDASSIRTLASALRRVDAPVRVILARRPGTSELEEAVDVERLSIGPLDVGPLRTLLTARLGRPFAHQTLVRIHEESGGNPIFALGLARMVDEDADPLRVLLVPPTLAEVVRARLEAVPEDTREVLAFAAATGSPSVSLLERMGADTGALDPAIAEHLVEREGGAIRFTHPLLSSVLYGDLGRRRRTVHERIAAVVADPVMRARHLALATDEPDAAVATALEEAAVFASNRAALAGAAELAEAALRLTPAGAVDEHRRRALAAARAERAAGEWTRARTLARNLLDDRGLGPLRADVLLLLAEFEGLGQAVALLEEAQREAASRPAMQAAIQCRLAWTTRHIEGFDAAFARARVALEMAEELDDDALRAEALSMMVMMGLATGDPEAPGYARRGYELALATGDARRIASAVLDLTDAIGDTDETCHMVERVYEDICDVDELLAADALRQLAHIEHGLGRWERAAEYADRAFDLYVQYGLEVPWIHIPISLIAVDRGQLDVARAHSERALQLAREQFGFPTPVHLGILGVAALRGGDPRAAIDRFEEAEATTTRLGWRDAGLRWWTADQVEALLALDRVDEAGRVLEAWEEGRPAADLRTLAHMIRCRGLLASARGDVSEAAALLEDAVHRHEQTGDSFGRARALLALGTARRRQLKKREASEAIVAALAGFEELGAGTWIANAHAELGRIGGRTRTEGLTPAEHRVAALVAKGRSNQEVAAALFLRVGTVETHLSHVYAKLGVRSRTELSLVYRLEPGSDREQS